MRIEVVAEPDPYAAALRIFRDLSPRTLILAGGSTPRPLYEQLANLDHPWAETDVFFSDERCVPPGDPDSNYRMAFESLLSKVPAHAHSMAGEHCDAGARNAELSAFFSGRPAHFDLAILGLGEDGHTASLFPGDPALKERDRLVARVQRPDHARLTLTLPTLSATEVAMFLVTGAAKAGAVQALLSGKDVPAARVQARRTLLVADAAALSRTPNGGTR